MLEYLDSNWKYHLNEEFTKPSWNTLTERITTTYTQQVVYPTRAQVFTALNLCPLKKIKVVVLGQDPYHGEGQAHGLAFSVEAGAIPPSLRNIYKEIARDIKTAPPTTGNLTRLATQGVLLLNATLTVEAGKPGSHQGWGWEQFTDAIIQTISDEREHIVFLLWGAYAQSKRQYINELKHLVLTASHPSPLSAHRGFIGCGHFSQTNVYLEKHRLSPIIW